VLLAASVTLSWASVFERLAVAAALGAAIGLERELRERQAGLRTHMLVSLGAALFTTAGAYGFGEFTVRVDPTRVAAQVVTGIGFLGAGAIIRRGPAIRGLTTAATLWVAAAIGLAAGAGFYAGAVLTTALVILFLWPLRTVAYRMLTRFRPEVGRLLVALPAGVSPGPLITRLESAGGRIAALEITQEGDRRHVEVDVALQEGLAHGQLVSAVAEVEQVLEVRWAG
jgi:putative Mg2+ transporter-C (MgtC) family protein